MADEKKVRDQKKHIGKPGFMYQNPVNFAATWCGITFGVLDGSPFMAARFKNRKEEDNWIDAETLFLRSMIERFEAYRAARGR